MEGDTLIVCAVVDDALSPDFPLGRRTLDLACLARASPLGSDDDAKCLLRGDLEAVGDLEGHAVAASLRRRPEQGSERRVEVDALRQRPGQDLPPPDREMLVVDASLVR